MKKMQDIPHTIRMKLATNAVLGVLILSIGALCLAPISESVSADNNSTKIYRQAGENAKGVSGVTETVTSLTENMVTLEEQANKNQKVSEELDNEVHKFKLQ